MDHSLPSTSTSGAHTGAAPVDTRDRFDTTTAVSPWRVWPLRRAALAVLGIGFVALLSIWSAAGLLYMWLFDDGPVGDADREVASWLEDQRTDRLNTLSTIGSGFSDTIVKVILVALVGGLMVAVFRRWHDGLMLAVTVIFEATVFVLTSFIVGRDRPPVEQLEEAAPSGSFPSGHAAAAVAFYATLLVIATWHTRRAAVRGALWVVAISVPIIVAVARTYRGMHHVSDVVAGVLLGLASIYVVHRALQAGTEAVAEEASTRALPAHVTRLDLTEPAPSSAGAPRSDPNRAGAIRHDGATDHSTRDRDPAGRTTS
jgi:membrane-associated phospholipid phosphatase